MVASAVKVTGTTPTITEQLIMTVLWEAARSGIDNIRGSTRFRDHTGNLRNIQTVSVTAEYLRFGTPLEYASFVNFGRGEVRPTRAKVLAWRTGGQTFFRYRAGPAAPRPFFSDAVTQIERFLEDHAEFDLSDPIFTVRTGISR